MLNIIMLGVVMMNVVMLSVVTPLKLSILQKGVSKYTSKSFRALAQVLLLFNLRPNNFP
jgi:hypothetical protein